MVLNHIFLVGRNDSFRCFSHLFNDRAYQTLKCSREHQVHRHNIRIHSIENGDSLNFFKEPLKFEIGSSYSYEVLKFIFEFFNKLEKNIERNIHLATISKSITNREITVRTNKNCRPTVILIILDTREILKQYQHKSLFMVRMKISRN